MFSDRDDQTSKVMLVSHQVTELVSQRGKGLLIEMLCILKPTIVSYAKTAIIQKVFQYQNTRLMPKTFKQL